MTINRMLVINNPQQTTKKCRRMERPDRNSSRRQPPRAEPACRTSACRAGRAACPFEPGRLLRPAVGKHWFAGEFLSANNKRNYTRTSAGFFVRFMSREQPSIVTAPTGLFPATGPRPVTVP
jgi:hypothetical protein